MFEWPYVPGAVSGSLLFFAGWRSYECWRELRQTGPAAFWALAALGLAYLAIDEWFAVHEWIAIKLFPELGVFNHPDDAIILAYAVMATAIGLLYWKQITADRRVFRWLALAAVATAIGGTLDGFGSPYFWLSAIAEESAELSAGVFAVTAMRLRLASARAASASILVEAGPGSMTGPAAPAV